MLEETVSIDQEPEISSILHLCSANFMHVIGFSFSSFIEW